MSNPLTREAGFKLGPIVLGTLVKHYLEKVTRDAEVKDVRVPLRKDELLYDEVFHIVKAFMSQASAKHTVEELQSFSNTATPSPPWVHVVRLVVPMYSCDEAAKHLVVAFGGEEAMKRTVGGVKWWQVRGVRGVSAEWIVARKDIDDARKYSAHTRSGKKKSFSGRFAPARSGTTADTDVTADEMGQESTTLGGEGASYQPEMDDMKCILYFHGGGYYFGSVDQERYSIQRFARKIHGRVFAVNYRLAPQYPFPCAIQDALASYLFLIRPPPGAAHRPVPPSSIVVAGDSAGGGLSLALLQVLRDAELPAPAGGVLISPWCDFTHSFPSIYSNTATDIIPATGLSLHKPSALWPPPSDEVASRVRNGLRKTVRDVLRRDKHKRPKTPEPSSQAPAQSSTPHPPPQPNSDDPAHPISDADPQTQAETQAPAPLQIPTSLSQTMLSPALESAISLGVVRTPADQLQLYAPNNLLTHPLVSPALAYLGGLPPLLFIASDREVLRDEIVFTAHKAADPEKYPVADSVRAMFPAFFKFEGKTKPTAVHLQIYDDAAHVLPILFPFTTPAKYCFRAFATFCKHVTAPSFTTAAESARANIPTTGSSTTRTDFTDSDTNTVNASRIDTTIFNGSNTPVSPPAPTIVLPTAYDLSPLTVSPQNESFPRIPASPSPSGSAASLTPDPSTGALSVPPALPSDGASTSSMEHDKDEVIKDGTGDASGDAPKQRNAEPPQGKDATDPAFGRAKSLHARSRASISTAFSRAASFSGRSPRASVAGAPRGRPPMPPSKAGSEDVGGPRKAQREPKPNGAVFAGDGVVYGGGWAHCPGPHAMLRERVSTQGVVRALEPAASLGAFSLPLAQVGVLPEAAVARYAAGKAKLEKKFARTSARIAEHRRQNLERAKQDITAHVAKIEHYLTRQEEAQAAGGGQREGGRKEEALEATASWSLAWAFDAEERPPPSSIVARRDTAEAIELARVADQALFASEKTISGNNLWGMVLNFFTVTPDKEGRGRQGHGQEGEKGRGEHGGKPHVVGTGREREKRRRRSTMSAFWKSKLGGGAEKVPASASAADVDGTTTA
ncbi:hypothetical protein OF83DRAFT_1172261 [Amylostereum chailletii]|nr:hypothetical protein OF83DRAFT_1172261 [Amylostereum chailletii]